MYILIMKNMSTKLVQIMKNVNDEYLFTTLEQATEKGELLLKQNNTYTSFNTMEANHFIEMMVTKFPIN